MISSLELIANDSRAFLNDELWNIVIADQNAIDALFAEFDREGEKTNV